MGYTLKKRRLVLKFEESAFEGAEVVCNLSAPVGLVQEVRETAGEDLAHFHKLMREQVIISWNLEDDKGTPIPLSEEGFGQVDHNFVMTIVGAWGRAIGNIDSPLDSGSNNGFTPGAALGQMENFTENPQSPHTSDG